MSLTLSSNLSPFPYAAAALAAYTKQAELIFDDASTGVSLDLSGAVISGEEKIVEELAKAGGLSSDTTAVRISLRARRGPLTSRFRLQPLSHQPERLPRQLLIQKLLPFWKGSTIAWPTGLSWLATISVLRILFSGLL